MTFCVERVWLHVLEHDHDTPGDGPLLAANETATLGRRRNLRDVDRDLSRADTNGQTVDDTTHNQHGDVLSRTSDD